MPTFKVQIPQEKITQRELIDWCKQTRIHHKHFKYSIVYPTDPSGVTWRPLTYHQFSFSHEKDALLFTLRWVGPK